MRWGWLGFLLCMGASLWAGDTSVTVRVHPNPVVVGQTCRVAISVPMAIASPTLVFQGNRYAMRALSGGTYVASWSTAGMGAGRHMGALTFVVGGNQVSVPVEIHGVLPAKAHQGIESGSRKIAIDKTTNDSLKIEELETEVLRLSLEKEALQYRVESLPASSEDSQAWDKQRQQMLAELAQKERDLRHKNDALSQQWEKLVAQKEVLTQTHEALMAKEQALVRRESEVASRDVALHSRAETLQKWSEVLQTQASDIATEKATLKDSHLALQRRQQDVQAQRSSLDAQSALLQVQSEQLNTALQKLNLSQQTWEAQYHDESRLLDDRQKVQQAREAEITAELLRLKGLQTQHETDQQALAKQSEALASQEQTLSQRQAQIQAQEQRLTQLYQEFQTHQERFFGLADQLQSRMALLEKRQTSQTEQSEAMALRLAQLEQINASLLATTPSEDAKKKTK